MLKPLHVHERSIRNLAADSTHVLIVEDDEVARTKLAGYLETAGHRVSEAIDGQTLRQVMLSDPVDLVLLDINLPGEDGLDLTRFIRASSDVGIILVTGRTDDVDRIVGLEIGADDYITKPFNPRELLARVKTLLRRTTVRAPSVSEVKTFSGWRFDIRSRRLVSPEGDRVALTRAEFELLSAMLAHPGNRVDPGAAARMHHPPVVGPGRPHGGRAGQEAPPEAGSRPSVTGAHHHRSR